METNSLMPCGKKDCTECESCKYDVSLEAPLLKMKTKEMRDFGIIPVGNNPSTAQIIIPGAATRHNVMPLVGPTQLALPFKEEKNSSTDTIYCNGCEFFTRSIRPNKESFNVKCAAETPIPGVLHRVIQLKVYEGEKVKKPFWCPMLKKSISKSLGDGIKIGNRTIYPARKTSAMSDEQLNDWNESKYQKERKEKWLSAPGLTSWADISIGQIYHLPPTLKKQRMNIEIKQKYVGSIQAIDVDTNVNVWFYKEDEEYKYMSLIR